MVAYNVSDIGRHRIEHLRFCRMYLDDEAVYQGTGRDLADERNLSCEHLPGLQANGICTHIHFPFIALQCPQGLVQRSRRLLKEQNGIE